MADSTQEAGSVQDEHLTSYWQRARNHSEMNESETKSQKAQEGVLAGRGWHDLRIRKDSN